MAARASPIKRVSAGPWVCIDAVLLAGVSMKDVLGLLGWLASS